MDDLPVELDRELELARIGRGRRLTCGAAGTNQRIAELVHGDDVGVVEEIEGIGDEIDAETLAEIDALGNAHIELEEHRHHELVAAEIAGATENRSEARNGEGLASIGQTGCGHTESNTFDVGRSGATAKIGSDFGSAEIETSIFAGNHVEGTPGRDFDERGERPIAEETIFEVLASDVRRTLEDTAGHPPMTLIVNRVALFVLREAAIGRFESGLKIGAVVDGVRPGVAGEQLEMPGEMLFQVDRERVVG